MQVFIIILAFVALIAFQDKQPVVEDNKQLTKKLTELRAENTSLLEKIDLYQKENEELLQENLADSSYYLTNAIACSYVHRYSNLSLCSDEVFNKAKELRTEGIQPSPILTSLYIFFLVVLFAVFVGIALGVVVSFIKVTSAFVHVRRLKDKIDGFKEKYQEMKKVETEHSEKLAKLRQSHSDLAKNIENLKNQKNNLKKDIFYKQKDLLKLERKLKSLEVEILEKQKSLDLMDF